LNPRKIVLGTLLDAATELYNWWMSSKEPGEGVVLGFNAGEYQPGQPIGEPPVYVAKRTREEVEEACEKLPTVQSMADQAAVMFPKAMFKTASARGTAIHLAVKRMVNGGDGPSKDPNFVAEVSMRKSYEDDHDASVPYGTRGSIRIDVLERRSDDVVCVYDLKTGKSGLTVAREVEIVGTVASVYPLARRILITEVRPSEMLIPSKKQQFFLGAASDCSALHSQMWALTDREFLLWNRGIPCPNADPASKPCSVRSLRTTRTSSLPTGFYL
jgi:hypothetical protein